MREITKEDIPPGTLPETLRLSNWRVWQYVEAVVYLAKREMICRICGHLARRHGERLFSPLSECQDCADSWKMLTRLPGHAVKGFWVGFYGCREFVPYDPMIHSALRLPGYAITVEEQRKRDEERARMPLELW